MCDFFEVKQANEEAKKAAINLKRSIRAMRVYKSGRIALTVQIKTDIVKYRLASRRARKLTSEYIKDLVA